MEKDFDKWNEKKKIIHASGDIKFYRPREIWWCILGVNIGFEQDGTGFENERPVLIMKGFSKNVCLVVPLTTSKKKNKYHVSIGFVARRESFVIISQLRLIDTKRLINRISILDIYTFENIRKTIKNLI